MIDSHKDDMVGIGIMIPTSVFLLLCLFCFRILSYIGQIEETYGVCVGFLDGEKTRQRISESLPSSFAWL